LTPEIKTQELEVFFEATHEKYGLLSRKQACPKGARAKRAYLLGSPLEKLRLPFRGRILLIQNKPFRGRPRKGLFGRGEFFQRIFLHKSQDWVIVGG